MSASRSLTQRAERFSPWLAALLGIVAIKAVLTISLQSVPFVYSYSGISYLLLLLLAAGFSIRNGIQGALRARSFWMLMAAGLGLWAVHQFLDLYYELGLHIDVPDASISDEVLFFHLVPMMAAVATFPSLNGSGEKRHRWILNALLILGFWTFLYGFVVAPYKYAFFIPAKYGIRYDMLYLVENLALILMLGVAAIRAVPVWKKIYLHLLGASALYAISSIFANLAADAGGYVNGKLYGLGLTASVCWFVWIPLTARAAPAEGTTATRSAERHNSKVSGWAMLSVVMISIPMVWELFHRTEPASIRTLRLIVATAAIVLLSGGAYLKEYLDKRELTAEQKRAEAALRASEERFRLAAQAGRMYAEDWDMTTGAVVRSGDLPGVLGVEDKDLGLTLQDLLRRVHPDDQALVAASLVDRVPELPQNQIRYRLTRPDGSIAWLERTDHAIFDEHQKLVRLVGMVTNITERKQAEDALRESEEKFRSVFQDAGAGMVIVSLDQRYLAANPSFCELMGYTEAELQAKTVESLTHPEDWPAFAAQLGRAVQEGYGFQRVEKRCVHKSGRIVYTESSGSLIRNSEGVPLYFVGDVLDITLRKKSEEALANFNRRLIQAQEEERTRIARELHDDINQRMALLAIRQGQLKKSLGGLSDDLQNQFSTIQRETDELTMSIYLLSHELYSSTLQLLGLDAAIRSWCCEFCEKRSMEVEFESDGVPTSLPAEVSLNLYRILQEALNNAAKHSGADYFNVQLWGTPGEIHLSVTDSGKGFDIDSAMTGRGLGLKSMRERVRSMNGHLAIDAKPSSGTTIRVRVPIDSGAPPLQHIPTLATSQETREESL